MDSNPDSHWQKNIFSNVSGFIVICLLGGTKAYLKLNMRAGKFYGTWLFDFTKGRNQEPRQVTFCLLSVFFLSLSNGLSSLLSFESAPTLLSVCEHSYSRQSNILNKEEIVPQVLG